MRILISRLVIAIAAILLLGACGSRSAQPTFTPRAPSPTATEVPAPADTPVPPPPPAPDTATAESAVETPVPAETPLPVTQAPAAEAPTAQGSGAATGLIAQSGEFPEIGEILPTLTPVADEDLIPVRELGVGEPGHYVNLTFGYELRYPLEWFTGFGNRPLLVSFSNLDPGTTNRESMRANGCLIEITTSTNTYNFTLATLLAQSPQTYEGAQETELGGIPAVLMVRENTGQPFKTEILQVIAQDRLFLITYEYQRERDAECRTIWDSVRADWQWFEPDLVLYKNQTYGYSISHPRRWYMYNATEQGIFISSIDPSTVTSAEELVREGMVVHTHVFENEELLPLKAFLVDRIRDLGLTSEIDLGTMLGVRSIKEGPAGSQAMIGYYQGPLGRIYVVEIFYPADRAREFRPIANAIIYSFDF